MMLHEKYRPTSLSEIVGNARVVAQCEQFMRAGIGGSAFWISGPSGTGKTTLAYAMMATLADRFYVDEVVGRDLTPARIDELFRACHLTSLGKGGRGVIVNEAHGMSRACIEKLLDVLEKLPRRACWIFTTTNAGQQRLFEGQIDGRPLMSRTVPIDLKLDDETMLAFARLAQQIAIREGLDGQPLAAYMERLSGHQGNLRQLLSDIQGGCMLAAPKPAPAPDPIGQNIDVYAATAAPVGPACFGIPAL